MDYKATLNLPKTDFPMKANLPQREPELLARWAQERLYERIQESRFGGIGARLNLLQRAFIDEERGLDGAVVSPEPHGMPRPVV